MVYNARLRSPTRDLLTLQLGQERFSWERGSIVAASDTRQAYVVALKAADAGDMALLSAFARMKREGAANAVELTTSVLAPGFSPR